MSGWLKRLFAPAPPSTGYVRLIYLNGLFQIQDETGALSPLVAESGSVAWGDIAGALADQDDLQAALDDKQTADALLSLIAALSDPGADKILFWDESANAFAWLEPAANLSITGTDLDAAGGAAADTGLHAFCGGI